MTVFLLFLKIIVLGHQYIKNFRLNFIINIYARFYELKQFSKLHICEQRSATAYFEWVLKLTMFSVKHRQRVSQLDWTWSEQFELNAFSSRLLTLWFKSSSDIDWAAAVSQLMQLYVCKQILWSAVVVRVWLHETQK